MITIESTKEFLVNTFNYVTKEIEAFCKGFANHVETTAILVLASLGLNYLLGELPFYFVLPVFIESAMVIPIISVLLILGLLWISQHRPRFVLS